MAQRRYERDKVEKTWTFDLWLSWSSHFLFEVNKIQSIIINKERELNINILVYLTNQLALIFNVLDFSSLISLALRDLMMSLQLIVRFHKEKILVSAWVSVLSLGSFLRGKFSEMMAGVGLILQKKKKKKKVHELIWLLVRLWNIWGQSSHMSRSMPGEHASNLRMIGGGGLSIAEQSLRII